jgi:hypothetical protein
MNSLTKDLAGVPLAYLCEPCGMRVNKGPATHTDVITGGVIQPDKDCCEHLIKS